MRASPVCRNLDNPQLVILVGPVGLELMACGHHLRSC